MFLSDVTEENEIFITSSFSFPVVETVVEEAEEVPLMFFPNSRIHSRFSLLFPCLSKRIEATKRKSDNFFFWQKAVTNERLPREPVQQTLMPGNLGIFFNFPRHEK